MQDDIEKLLSDKFSETISDSTALRLLNAVNQLLSLLSTKENDMRQKLININKKFERIESNIFKTKTNIEIYAIAIKIESLTYVDVTTTTRRSLDVSTTQQKIFTKIKKKTMMIKINNEAKKIIIRIMIIKDVMRKLKTIEKKEKNILSIKRLFSDDLKLLARFEKTKERMKQNKKILHDITFSTTAMRCTYVVLAHNVRMSNVNTFNQQTIINQIVKQNSNLHKDLNIIQIIWTKKIERLRKEHFSLIIELISFEMINKLIKNDLLNDYFHRVCEYLEKKCKIKQCFRCQKYDHVNKAWRNDEKCDFCACEHSSFECRTFNEHRRCANCVDKHSAWSFQCDVKTKKKQKFNTIWNNKSFMHFELSTNDEATSIKNRFYVVEGTQMRSFATFQQTMNLSTQQNTQYDFTMMSLDLNENINRFSFFSQFMINAVIRKNHQSSRRRRFDARSALCR